MSDGDIIKDFLIESRENLDRLDRDLVGLEKNPNDKDSLAGVFRTIHTIKGTCGFLGFNKLEKVAHVGENLLSRLRDGQLTLNPEITTALLGMVDAIRQMLKEIDSTGTDGAIDYPELRESLTQLQNSAASAARQESPIAAVPPQIPSKPTPPVSKSSKKSKHAAVSEAAAAIELPAKVETKTDDPQPTQVQEPKPRDAAAETIRVGVNLLDKLMTQVGELVLARN